MTRVTEKQLEQLAVAINQQTKSPVAPWGSKGANIGNYHISHAYGGVCLHRMTGSGGAVRDVLYCGHVPKRELANRMSGYLQGLRDAQEIKR